MKPKEEACCSKQIITPYKQTNLWLGLLFPNRQPLSSRELETRPAGFKILPFLSGYFTHTHKKEPLVYFLKNHQHLKKDYSQVT